MNFTKLISYWKQGAEKDFEVAEGLYSLKHYAHCLFFCHLTLEKSLKALYVLKHNEHAPYIHDLVILAKKIPLQLTMKQTRELETITSFNIQGRYAGYKSDFYKNYNNSLSAKKYMKVTQSILLCLEKK